MYYIKKHEERAQSKTCRSCNKIKDLSEFPRDSSRKDGYSYRCKECSAKEQYNRYHADPQKARNQRKANRVNNHEINKLYRLLVTAIMNSIKEDAGCEITGSKIDLDFHHLDKTTKRFSMSHAFNYSWDTIFLERAKCVVVTSSMHAKIHRALEGKSIENPSLEFSAFMLSHYSLVPVSTGDKTTYIYRPSMKLAA